MYESKSISGQILGPDTGNKKGMISDCPDIRSITTTKSKLGNRMYTPYYINGDNLYKCTDIPSEDIGKPVFQTIGILLFKVYSYPNIDKCIDLCNIYRKEFLHRYHP